jgi:hypothetical protein
MGEPSAKLGLAGVLMFTLFIRWVTYTVKVEDACVETMSIRPVFPERRKRPGSKLPQSDWPTALASDLKPSRTVTVSSRHIHSAGVPWQEPVAMEYEEQSIASMVPGAPMKGTAQTRLLFTPLLVSKVYKPSV